MSKNHNIIGKYIISGTIENMAPLLIASGMDEEFDFQVIRKLNLNNRDPYIPASGFAGYLRTKLHDQTNELSKYIWGNAPNDNKVQSYQSHLIIDDLFLEKPQTAVVASRDGVKIEYDRQLADEKESGKYDYEFLEPGCHFVFHMELTVREIMSRYLSGINQFLEDLKCILNECELIQGAFKTSGFGKLNTISYGIWYFDFKHDEDKVNWLHYLSDQKIPSGKKSLYEFKYAGLKKRSSYDLEITGNFHIKSALNTRMENPGINEIGDAPDHLQLVNSKGIPILTGKAIKGAIRHRAYKIAKTLQISSSDTLIEKLFGYVDKSNKTMALSKLHTEDVKLEGVKKEIRQTRIKIDRFTQGTIESALLVTQPVWHGHEQICIKITMKKCDSKELALMLFVLRDLFHQDLAIGGEKAIGRGILVGKSLKISGKVMDLNQSLELEFDKDGLVSKKDIELVKGIIKKLTN